MTGGRSSAPARARRDATRPACRHHALASMNPARPPRLHPQQVPSRSPAIRPCPSHERLLLHAAARRSAAPRSAPVPWKQPRRRSWASPRPELPSKYARRHGARSEGHCDSHQVVPSLMIRVLELQITTAKLPLANTVPMHTGDTRGF
jgi:hypothetical protein